MPEIPKLGKSFEEKLHKGIEDALHSVINEKAHYYKAHPEKRPSKAELNSLVFSYSNQVALISGGMGLIPGPAGLLAAVSEIVMVIKNQISMIYDIGVAYGKEEQMSSSLVLSVYLSSTGLGVITMQGGKLFVQQASMPVIEQMISFLGAKVTQGLLGSLVAKWVPVLGAGAMAAWGKYSTMKLGNKAISVLDKHIEERPDVAQLPDLGKEAHAKLALEHAKLQTLINVVNIDRKSSPAQHQAMEALIEKSSLGLEQKLELAQRLQAGKLYEKPYEAFKNHPEETISLMMDMLGLAKADSDFDLSERLYLKQVCKDLGLNETETAELLSA